MKNTKRNRSLIISTLSALLILATLGTVSPVNAAKPEANSYKPSGQEGGQKKAHGNKNKANRPNNKQTGKDKNNNANKVQSANPRSQDLKKSPAAPKNNHTARASPPKKKKHTKDKLNSFLKDTLKFLDDGNYSQYSDHRRSPYRSKSYQNHKDDYDQYDRNDYSSCIPHSILKKRLYRKGWHDFELINEGEYRTRLLASNHENYRFKIVIDNCSGVILKAFPVNHY